jgi:methylglutaconyl-CoA hydratase
MNQGLITTQIANGCATITFSHPKSNSFPTQQLQRLKQEFDELATNDAVQIILLKSEGDSAFSAGASFNELLNIKNLEQGTAFFKGFANVILAMRDCPKLIIGRTQGKAVGGGIGLLSACDYVFASEKAAIKLSEISIGIGPFVIEPAVTRKMGVAAFSELSINAGNWFTAYWAKEKGLYARVYESMLELDKDLEIFIEKLCKYNPEALRELKKTLWHNTDSWDALVMARAAVSGKLVLSDFTKKALEQFKK